ncbi:MAG TPA: sensor histidine kinase [Steroidobacteraceae bacterium]|jgi:signal transduction histidine kinase|nr:sensor histidine kinase [Steroidobacteraceae bacterium]
MRLGDFILRDMELILQRWEAFATTRLPAAEHLSSRALRDHGPEILQAIVADLASAQTPDEQKLKSMGLAPVAVDAPQTAAQTHAVLRAESGFDIEQLASEYRALRASVLSAWMTACSPEPPRIDDMIRFNEAIDQALAESISFFTAHITRSRKLLLGMMSHDLRSPLQTIKISARLLQALNTTADVGRVAERLIRSGVRMQKLLDDLIDFNRTELGLGIKVSPRDADLGQVCAEELEQIRAAYAERYVELDVSGDCRGYWDPDRIQQLLNNLVGNALHYGEPHAKVHVAVHGGESDVRLSVANTGKTIDGETLAHIFEPLRRGTDGVATNDSGLGLGLFIASEIARAHGGAIAAASEQGQTLFTVSLPKNRRATGTMEEPRSRSDGAPADPGRT